MSFRRNHVLERYTPAEAELVTGVNAALQRDWRRRGLLPETGSGHARYTAAELAEMVLMQDFAVEGLGPKALRDMLGLAAKPLAKWVESLAWTNDVIDVEAGIPEHQLPARYVVLTDGKVISTGDLNEAFSHQVSGRFGFVCNLRAVAEHVVAKVPRPVWRREAPQSTKAEA